MGMLLTNPSFAEQIIEKYSSMESYYFDDGLLVFYRQGLGIGAGASSAYYTELALKLLFMFQNYRRSGQRLNLNWNLLNQAVLNQAAVSSREVERVLRPMLQENQIQLTKRMNRIMNAAERAVSETKNQTLKSVLSGENVQKQIQVFLNAQQSLIVRREKLKVFLAAPQRLLEWEQRLQGGMPEGQTAEERMKEIRELADAQEHLNSQRAQLAAWLDGIGRREQKLEEERIRLQSLLEMEQTVERRMAQVKNRLSADEWEGIGKEIWEGFLTVLQTQERERKQIQELLEDVKTAETWKAVFASVSETENREELLNQLFFSEGMEQSHSQANVENVVERLRTIIVNSRFEKAENMALRFINGIGAANMRIRLFREREKEVGQIHVEEWIRQMSTEEQELVWETIVRYGDELLHVIPGGKELGEKIRQLARQSGLRPGFKLSQLSSRQPEAVYQFIRQMILSSPGNRNLKGQVRDRESAGISIRMGSRGAEIVTSLFRKYEDIVFRNAEKTRIRTEAQRLDNMALFSDVITIMENRFTQPGRAREAEKELWEILRHDLSLDETHLVWREKDAKQSIQEKEERILSFVKLLEAPKAMAVIRRRIEETQEKEKERLREWVRKYRIVTYDTNTNNENEKRELLTQVRESLGNDTARTLERYLTARERNADYGTRYETVHRMDETVKHIIDSYMNVVGKEDVAAQLGGGESFYLRNRMREQVHEPSSRPEIQARRNLDAVMNMVRRDYQIRRERTLLIEKVREHIHVMALKRLDGENADSFRGWMAEEIYRRHLREFPESFEEIVGHGIQRGVWENGGDILQSRPEMRQAEGGHPPVMQNRRNQEGTAGKHQWEEVETQFFRRQRLQETQLEETRKKVTVLKEKIELQEKALTELKNHVNQNPDPVSINVSQLTRQVMKKMEEELRVEKMRRGLL